MSNPLPDENRDLVPPSVGDMTFIAVAMILGLSGCLILALAALRADRPAACDPYPSYAECSAALAEGV